MRLACVRALDDSAGELLWPAACRASRRRTRRFRSPTTAPRTPGLHEERLSSRARLSLRTRDAGDRRRALQLLVARRVSGPAYREQPSVAPNPRGAFDPLEFMALVRNYRRNAWLVTYLFGASPAMCKSFRPEGHELLDRARRSDVARAVRDVAAHERLRLSQQDAGALADLANSLGEYVAGLAAAVTTVEPRYAAIGVVVDGEYRQLNANILQIENEYYSAIRPKPSKATYRRPPWWRCASGGVEYVEVRTLDLSIDGSGRHQSKPTALLEMLLLVSVCSRKVRRSTPRNRARSMRATCTLPVKAGGRGSRSWWPAESAAARGVRSGDRRADGRGRGAARRRTAKVMRGASMHARDALREPERTPSAALACETSQTERAGFFEYAFGARARLRRVFPRACRSIPRRSGVWRPSRRGRSRRRPRSSTGGSRHSSEYLRAYAAELCGPAPPLGIL